MNILLSFDIGEFTGCSFIEKVYLSTFCFILPCFTMMFLCMILLSSSLRFQRAKDHQNRSPDEKVMPVLVPVVLQFLHVAVVQPGTASGTAGATRKPFSAVPEAVVPLPGAVVPLPGARF